MNKHFNSTHGMTETRQYKIWSNIKDRCNNPKNKSFKDYGGRGIKYCKSWEDFNVFWKDMSKGYRHNLQIDRIDNNGNYCKNNCRWVTPSENSRKRRDTVYVRLERKNLPLVEIAEKFNIHYGTLYSRIFKYKMSPKQAITLITKTGRQKKEYMKLCDVIAQKIK